MIVPMKKVSLLVLDKERAQALQELRRLSVMHVEKRPVQAQSIATIESLVSRLDQADAILADYPAAKKAPPIEYPGRDAVLAFIDRVIALREEKRNAMDTIASSSRELDRLFAWGDINPEDFDYLADKGIYLFPFEMTVSDYLSIPESVRSIIVNRDKKTIRCLIWGEDDLLHADMPQGARELSLPDISTQQLRALKEQCSTDVLRIDQELATLSAQKRMLEPLKRELLVDLEFETVREGMEVVDMSTQDISTANLSWLTGYVPSEDIPLVRSAAQTHGWAFIASDPTDEDMVPTKIRNNRFVSLISPLLDFLGTVPGYREIDISLWFLLFFGIFFAMIFGDAGYGMLLSLGSAAGILVGMAKGKKPPTALFMFLYLGLMTVAWGTITCTWFGIPYTSLPPFFASISLPAFSNANVQAPENIKIFCFTLALVHISLAHIIGFVRNIKSPKALGELGSLALAVGMYFVVLNLVVDAQKYPMTNVVLGLVGGGFFLNFVFINFDGSLGKGIVESLKNIITMVLGVVNMFGDIMSYIRLWAVGLAGAAISQTINQMAGPMLGGVIIFAGMILLLFGHGLNTVMNVLSVLVHGVRLNTLEFSNHLGLTWSGFKYEPFSETVNK